MFVLCLSRCVNHMRSLYRDKGSYHRINRCRDAFGLRIHIDII